MIRPACAQKDGRRHLSLQAARNLGGRIRAVLAAFALGVLPSCASMMARSPVMVPIAAEPPGASVTYHGAQVGRTPCTIEMQTRDGNLVDLALEGYHKQTVNVGWSGGGWVPVFIGFLMFGPVEIVGDLIGGTDRPDCDPVMVKLVPESEPAPACWCRPIQFQL